MSEESQRTYTEREILLELFPATDSRLIPGGKRYWLERQADGNVVIHLPNFPQPLILSPVTASGSPTTQLCCDVCGWSAPRHYLQMFRIALPGSHGRRFRYISLCRDHKSCRTRLSSDAPLKTLLARVFDA